jgi:hypothetical protein
MNFSWSGPNWAYNFLAYFIFNYFCNCVRHCLAWTLHISDKNVQKMPLFPNLVLSHSKTAPKLSSVRQLSTQSIARGFYDSVNSLTTRWFCPDFVKIFHTWHLWLKMCQKVFKGIVVRDFGVTFHDWFGICNRRAGSSLFLIWITFSHLNFDFF